MLDGLKKSLSQRSIFHNIIFTQVAMKKPNLMRHTIHSEFNLAPAEVSQVQDAIVSLLALSRGQQHVRFPVELRIGSDKALVSVK